MSHESQELNREALAFIKTLRESGMQTERVTLVDKRKASQWVLNAGGESVKVGG